MLQQRIVAALKDVRLGPDYLTRFPDQLSGGERQRVAIARALVSEPELLLCDEILSALDVSVQAEVLDLLGRLRRERALTMLFISHDLAVVRGLADRVGVLYRGELMELGVVDAIFRPPFHPYTLTLLLAVPGGRQSMFAPAAPVRSGPAAAPSQSQNGCAFAGRCPWQLGALCESTPPPWQEIGSELRIRCHIPVPELAARAVAGRAGEPCSLP
jgi:peptide/nickel transport system ATP-binding protein